jgi:hypothetical protein
MGRAKRCSSVHRLRQLHAPDLDRANIEHSAVRFAMPP